MVFVGRVLYFLLPTLAIFVAAWGSSESKSVNFINCGPDVIQDVSLTPCSSEPCTFSRGVDANIGVTFVSKGTATTVTAKVHALVAGEQVPRALFSLDGCNGSNLICPLQPGEHTYKVAIPVFKDYQIVNLAVKLELVDEKGQQLVCFQVPAAIKG